MDNFPYTNQLIHQSSPYLLQHAHNPVNWYPWGDEALEKAKKENKLLIISIGYSACHWCHVMEHESFEDSLVADLMNKYFISIKVDREERPDVDQIYMNAAQLINGSGGWPLNAFALSDGKPFYAGTYFPKNDWIKVLKYFADLQLKNPQLLTEQANKVTNGIRTIENVPLKNEKIVYSMHEIDNLYKSWKPNIDFVKGGGNHAPKFPMPTNWEYLLYYSYLSNNSEALQAVTTTLDNMAFGGIYEHIGGGFARYSTDVNWHVPHFEKMLYDNAQLISLYSHAWQQTKKPLYRKVVYETLEFIERELASPEGGFYSSLDADSDGDEGKFYSWTKAEIEKELGTSAPLFNDFYNITNSGNWEHGKNILFMSQTEEEFATRHEMSLSKIQMEIEESRLKLLKVRGKRIKPGIDDKILTSWNALMIKGLVDAYRAFGEERFLEMGKKNADFLIAKSVNIENGIYRNYKNGQSTIHGFLDDYAFVISAFIALYQATFEEKWLNQANKLTLYTIEHFFDEKSGMFFYTHDNHSNLISRKMEISDNVIPASNSEMAKNLFLLGQYLYNENYIDKSEQMLVNIRKDAHQNIYFYSNWGIVELFFAAPFFEVAIVGPDAENKRIEMDREYFPNVAFLGGKSEGTLALLQNKWVEGTTTIYVCHDKTCKLPTSESNKAKQLIKKE